MLSLQNISLPLMHAITQLQKGGFILLHDSSKREDETDLVIAAQFLTSESVAKMRKDAGGLLCVAMENSFSKNIGLRYMHEILMHCNKFDDSLKSMIYGLTKYGDHPTFSISVNHVETRTGITDVDRAVTIRNLANIYDLDLRLQKPTFVSSFRTPGHVPLLIAEDGLLKKRRGHTEMSVFLMGLANLKPLSVICEMMDSDAHVAMSSDEIQSYAKANNIPLLEESELLDLV